VPIDGFTVLAQIVNFLILIWLLNRFLFQPVRKAMDHRKKEMAEALNRARQAEQEAQAQARALEREKTELAETRENLMAEARQEVDRWRETAMERAREGVESLRKAWMNDMARDRQAFLDRLKRRLVHQVVKIGDKTLRDLSNQGLNRQVVRVFLEKVAARKEVLNHRAAGQELIVQSGIPLDDADDRVLRNRLAAWFPTAAPVRLEVHPELGLGIQLAVGDRMAAWHLADYLTDLEAEIMDNLFDEPRTNA
jgi:F-type H+-transporting ATPase subunit b